MTRRKQDCPTKMEHLEGEENLERQSKVQEEEVSEVKEGKVSPMTSSLHGSDLVTQSQSPSASPHASPASIINEQQSDHQSKSESPPTRKSSLADDESEQQRQEGTFQKDMEAAARRRFSASETMSDASSALAAAMNAFAVAASSSPFSLNVRKKLSKHNNSNQSRHRPRHNHPDNEDEDDLRTGMTTTEDESDEDDCIEGRQGGSSLSNPQDRYCTDCEIQFKSFKTFKVHKQYYCGSRHAGSKVPSSSAFPSTSFLSTSEETVGKRRDDSNDGVSKNNRNHHRQKSSSVLSRGNNTNGHNCRGSYGSYLHQDSSKQLQSKRHSVSPASSSSHKIASLGDDNNKQTLNGHPNLSTSGRRSRTSPDTMNLNDIPGLMASMSGSSSSPSNSVMHPLQILGLNPSPSSSPFSLLSPSVLLNQPIFVAISTNPMILVPCTYNASTGGLNFPNNNNGSSNTTNLMNSNLMNQSSSSHSHQVFPREEEEENVAFIQHKSNKNPSFPKESSLKQPHLDQHEDEEEERCSSKNKNRESRKSRRELQPLDLSSKPMTSGELLTSMGEESSIVFHPKESCGEEEKETPGDKLNESKEHRDCRDSLKTSKIGKQRRHSNAIVIAPGSSFLNKPPHHHDTDVTTDDNNSRSSCYSPANHGGPPLQLPGIPIPIPLVAGMAIPSAASDALHHQGIIKQGTYKCKDCNIVFYKHENYLVHKSLYCASRRLSEQLNSGQIGPHLQLPSSPSPDPPESDHAPHSSPEVSLDGKPNLFSGRGHTTRSTASPGRSITSTPPLASPPHHQGQHHGPLYQYCCVACGIRFTSMDTLQAHQAFYCLKRAGFKNLENGFLPSMNGDKVEVDRSHIEINSSPPPMNVPLTNGTPHVVVANSSNSISYSASASTTTTIANNNSINHKSSHGSHSNLQSFKCTICGYKGHTMRGMRTHVRIHADQMQGSTEEAFIEYLHEDSHLQASNEKRPLTGPGSRGTRRKSLDPEPSSSSSKRRRSNHQLRY